MAASSSPGLVRPLRAGPLDLVGDVHGEFDALVALLARLGYEPDGRHPDGRRLVFVGDLVDRGPDSPAVVHLVRDLVKQDLAQVVVGNHELNILRKVGRHGNHWIPSNASSGPSAEDLALFGPTVLATAAQAEEFRAFFDACPVALERSDLRVAHAAWIDEAVDALRGFQGTVLEAHDEFDRRADASAEGQSLRAADKAVRKAHHALLHQAEVRPPNLPEVGRHNAFRQNSNPLRVLTSGVERPVEVPFHAGGKWRFVSRAPWWLDYRTGPPVIVGHFWRWWHPQAHSVLSKGEPQLDWGGTPDAWARNADGEEVAFCVDFSVGARWKERSLGHPRPYHGRLAALRWPERELVFDGPDPGALPV